MATFATNIKKIRGEAVHGPEMRAAIADAIQQAVGLDIEGGEGTVYFVLTPIEGTAEDYLLDIDNGDS